MNKKVIAALSSLGIPVAYMEYKGEADSYIMFQVYNEQDAEFYDDENQAEIFYIEVNYYFDNPADFGKAKEIKRLMKQAGFIFDGAKDLYDDGTYGKNLEFIYKEYLEE